MIPRAVLFDLDGTLADSYDAITASTNHVRAVNGLPPLPEAEIKKHVGRGLAMLLADLVPGTDTARNIALYGEHHVTVMRDHTRLMPGARHAVEALKRSGRRLAVCSNKNVVFTRALLESLGLAPFFDVVLGPEDVPQPKPAPDIC
jgi:phosphoglycolate phosphatase